jgi:hypothetical protein
MLRLLLCLCLFCPLAATASASARPQSQVVTSGGYSIAIAPVPDWVKPRDLREAWPDDAPGATGVATRTWLFDSQTDLRGNAHNRYIEYTHQVLSAQALAQSAQVQWSFEPNYQTLTLHAIDVIRNGKASTRIAPERITLTRRETEFERLMLDGMVTMLVVLPDVQVGDIIRLRISVNGSNPILGGMTAHFFSKQMDVPVLDRSIRILADKKADLLWSSSDPGITMTRADAGRHAEWSYAAERLGSARLDADTPSWWPSFGELVVGPRREWRDVARWASTLYPEASGPRLDRKTEEIRVAGGPEQQVLAALRFVQDDIRYFGVEMGSSTHRPAEPDLVLERRFGDCKDKARLLSAILQGLGHDAVPALVSASTGRAIDKHPPNATSFDHVIVRLRLAGHTYWLDPTLTLQRGGLTHLGFPDYGVALPIARDTTGLVAMEPPAGYLNESKVEEEYAPSNDATMQLVVRSTYRGAWADATRREVAGRAHEELQKQWTDYYSRLLDGATAVENFVVADNEATNELVITERYLLPALWRSGGTSTNFVDLDAYGITQRLNLNVSPDRKSPLALYHPAKLEHTTRLTPPAGSHLKLVSESSRVDTAAFDYSRELEVKENSMVLANRVVSKADHVPATELPEYLARLKQVRNGVATRVSIEFQDASASPRNERLRRVLNDLLEESRNVDE